MDWIASLLSQEHVKLWLSVGWTLYIIVVSVWILLQRSQPVATLSWLLSMAALPVVGLVIYYFFGPQRMKRQRIKRLRSRKRSQVRASIQRLRERMPNEDARLHQVARLVAATSDFPVSTATGLHLLTGGAATFDAIMQAVTDARHHVHLEYYIYEPDQTGTALRDLLVQKAKQGVQVRLLVDALGSKKLGRKFLKPLLDAGAEVARFHDAKIGRRVRPVVNFRTHRKILVCDGLIGFTGGVNVTDEENERIRSDAYHDVHLQVQGAVVSWLQTVFMEDWTYALGRKPDQWPADIDLLLPDCADGDTPMQVITSGPDNSLQAIYRAHLASIHAAEQRVWLTTPYFVPTEAALAALTNAALRGVDVQILVPKKSDSIFVTAAARSYFDELIRCGVRVHEYAASMLHSKTLVVDDNIAIIGTANFDYRSFFLNYEVCLIGYGSLLNAELAEQFKVDLKNAQVVHYKSEKRFLRRLFDSVARLTSPLL
ncbi:cardiolipin synthase [Comamonas testosteroni]|uniref:Cardiolipin synthase n=1 Tax=Comamonas testosteroni TaxID=285 RepID=A0A373FM93_COMTE|nr:cardiolipin synthase [Comamonas testosteroni]RGE45281.1 cardiolipin synthase [Comamonas testosteroni]